MHFLKYSGMVPTHQEMVLNERNIFSKSIVQKKKVWEKINLEEISQVLLRQDTKI